MFTVVFQRVFYVHTIVPYLSVSSTPLWHTTFFRYARVLSFRLRIQVTSILSGGRDGVEMAMYKSGHLGGRPPGGVAPSKRCDICTAKSTSSLRSKPDSCVVQVMVKLVCFLLLGMQSCSLRLRSKLIVFPTPSSLSGTLYEVIDFCAHCYSTIDH